MHAYRNRNNPNHTAVFAERNARLDALDNWELIENAVIPAVAVEAAAQAAAERRMIEEAAQHRLARAKDTAETSVASAEVRETTACGASEAQATLALLQPVNPPAATEPADEPPVTKRPRARETISQAEAQAVSEAEIANPPTTGVLSRAHADQRSGAVQIGDNPEAHKAPTVVASEVSAPAKAAPAKAAGKSAAAK